MNMPAAPDGALWERIRPGLTDRQVLSDSRATVRVADLGSASVLDRPVEALRGRSVVVAAADQLVAALALLELDGVAGMLTLWPPDLSSEHLPAVASMAGADAIVSDVEAAGPSIAGLTTVAAGLPLRRRPSCPDRSGGAETRWVLLTSGTTGLPKLAVHTLAALTGPAAAARPDQAQVWSTFYDIRRYGGLQILLRALLGGGSMMLTNPKEPLGDTVRRLASGGVSFLSGTPSHWRRILMSGAAGHLSPANVRLSGEIADQAILDRLRRQFPNARITHAFASTEAGVAFEVSDGREGFPVAILGSADGAVVLRVRDGTLRIRSSRTALGYLGGEPFPIDAEGFVDTGDLIQQRGDRCHFVGRRGGVINVGGQKVFPEEIEAVINRHPKVHVSRVAARRSPITGAIVAAEVVLAEACDTGDPQAIEAELRSACADELAPHKVPATFKFRASLPMTAGGKLGRDDA